MIAVQLADGTELEFPDGTADAVIDKAVKSQMLPAKQSFLDSAKQQAGNLAAGAVRGAGSIGATILAPYDIAKDALRGRGLSLQSNRERRSGMDGGLAAMGAETDSLAYGAGKLGTEVLGTLGTGGAIANAAARVAPKVAQANPALIEALRTGGMSAQGAGMVTRVAGGAVTGAASAGLIDPQDATAGAAVGAVAPGAVKALGAAGERLGAVYEKRLADQLRTYQAKAPLRETIQESVKAGYRIPPSSVNPSFTNRVLESISGKQATQQLVSTKNSEVTEGLVRKALGISDDVPLTSGTLESLRKTAGRAYADVSSLSPQAVADLEALKVARNEAQGWFKAYNRSASPADLAKAKEARALSDSLEQALEGHAKSAGKDELVPALREARQQIAKTYTVSRALNDASGTVDARVLGRMYEKGAPLTDELRTAGRFASAFPTAAKSPQQIGSPDVHNLKSIAGMLAGGAGGMAAAGPVGLAGAAVPFVAPPLARALLLREGAQKALVSGAPQASATAAQLAAALRNPELQQLLIRSSPALAMQP